MIFASLAVAIVVPMQQLSLVNGLNVAFAHFYDTFHIHWMIPVTEVMIIIGGFAGVTTWIIGPTKSLLIAAKDRSLPAFFAKTNRHKVPTRILLVQWVIVLILCGTFILLPTISSAYWLLSDMTAQLALIYYMILFVSAIYLRYKCPDRDEDAYMIPGGNKVMWLVVCMGMLACVVSIIAGFFPPSDLKLASPWVFEVILVSGIVVFFAIPLIIYYITKRVRDEPDHP